MSQVIKDLVREYSEKEGIGLNEDQLEQLSVYAQMLVSLMKISSNSFRFMRRCSLRLTRS